ncbi:MAG TPA: 23S rRNA (adenine(2030)-N(6))-methyltransferase RlmJ [Opitutaceae bacterium]|nr:23S rRNA (adenine(2030)-N(6))-methyltransferase RlmJ [Opitutaceae bacterium]
MNYRHSFHAGNYGDVFKHTLLVLLLRALQRKAKGFLYLDTHAGRGAYDLRAAAGRPERPPEWPQGIGRLWNASGLLPPLADFVALVRAFDRRAGAGGARPPRLYPGSPWLAALVRRPQDRLALWEQQPAEARALRAAFARWPRVAVTAGDGYGALRALLPPPERRALVLIDPPFEAQNEFEAILDCLGEGRQRFPSGVYAVWYPVTERARADAFHAALRRRALAPTLWAELAVSADAAVRMKGCGLVVLNPPWGFAQGLPPVLAALSSLLGVGAGAAGRMDWLVPET